MDRERLAILLFVQHAWTTLLGVGTGVVNQDFVSVIIFQPIIFTVGFMAFSFGIGVAPHLASEGGEA